MELIMAMPRAGITFLIVLLIAVFFQVIIHNARETKRYNKIKEQLNRMENEINNLKSGK